MNITKLLFASLRSEICGVEEQENIFKGITDEALIKLYDISKRYDITPIITSYLSKNGLLKSNDISKRFQRELSLSIYRYERMHYDFECICRTFEDEMIPYIPLKGSIIRKFYPEPWMRTSCDIDILLKEEDLERATTILVEKFSFTTDGQRDYHDISLFSQSRTHLELHFNIMENIENIDGLLAKAWDYAKPETESGYKYELSNEFLLFHIISHMSYHFICGGCGVRSFVDLYLLEKNLQYDEKLLSEMCTLCSIEKFRKAIEHQSAIWFENLAENDISREMQVYIFSGGLYGSPDINSAIKQAKTGGKFKYILSRVFQPYNIIKNSYPILKNHKWMMPIYQIKRWIDIVTTNRRNRIATYVNADKNISKEQISKKISLLKELGLE